jgi:endonuclease/exonuclease/phosphatase family metal-dependent hydrolase
MANSKIVNPTGANPGSITRFVIVSYNLHGFNQGSHGIRDLIKTVSPDMIMLQEHWLSPDNLYKLNTLSADYFVFASSAMNGCVDSGPLIGRPFGGTAIIIKKTFASLTTTLVSRERFTAVKLADWIFVTVYLPCNGTFNRDTLYYDVLADIDVLIGSHPNSHVMIAGDFNTDLLTLSNTSTIVNEFIENNNLFRCDALFPTASRITYFNDSTSAASAIDYILTSNCENVIAFNILDIDVNLSDHLPLMAICALASDVDQTPCDRGQCKPDDVTYLRWDHAPTDLYYNHSYLLLQPVLTELDSIIENCTDNASFNIDIDRVYNRLIDSLRQCGNMFIPKRKKCFYKFWWSQELDVLKNKAIASHRTWKDANKPRQGVIFSEYKKDKLIYKKRIRDEQANETCKYSNDLHDALLAKNGQAFWQTWKSKFQNNKPEVIQVGGIVDRTLIANNFLNYFANNCSPSNKIHSEEIKSQFNSLRESYCGSVITENNIFDVELISNLISSMSNGKAAGLDEITCEHLKFCHPIIVKILTSLFNVFISSGHIPVCFGASYTVPIPKCDGRTRALSINDFRGISISPVLSKLFEMAILNRYSYYLTTSDCQFGFKKDISCKEAIYCVRNVIESFVSNGSTVNVCTLDLSKAFDRMCHYSLFIKLMEREIPMQLLMIIEKWFNESLTCVKWYGCVTHFIRLEAGVRQGGVLSPVLFSIFMDEIIERVKSSNVGCYMNSICCCIFLYADDIILLSPTVHGLQVLLNVCEKYLIEVGMSINVKKSVSIRFGPRFSIQCTELVSLFGGNITWASSCRYLGVFFISGRTFRCSFDNAKCRFFRAFNALYSKVGRLASEEVIISLLRTKCLPILFYAIEACPLLKRTRHSFEFSVTRIFMKVFCTGSPSIVKECQRHFNFLPIESQIIMRTARFLAKFTASLNSMCSLFSCQSNRQLNEIFVQFNVFSVGQLRGVLLSQLHDG